MGNLLFLQVYRGHLQEFIGETLALQYMKKLDKILIGFGVPTKTFSTDDSIIDLCKKNGLRIKRGIVKHFGTENSLRIMNALLINVS